MIRKTEEEKVLDYLRENGGHFSAFWATENQRRANALDRLIAVIVSRDNEGEGKAS
jgi:hypothetical protein